MSYWITNQLVVCTRCFSPISTKYIWLNSVIVLNIIRISVCNSYRLIYTPRTTLNISVCRFTHKYFHLKFAFETSLWRFPHRSHAFVHPLHENTTPLTQEYTDKTGEACVTTDAVILKASPYKSITCVLLTNVTWNQLFISCHPT